MDDLEQKLRAYYGQIEPGEEFLAQLKGLEDTPSAKPRPRRVRRYLLPAAAAIMAAVALGSAWAYLRASMPGNPPPSAAFSAEAVPTEPGSAAQPSAPAEPSAAAPAAPAKPAVPPAPASPAPASPAPQTPAQAEPQAPPPREPSPQATGDPIDDAPKDVKPDDGAEAEPATQADPIEPAKIEPAAAAQTPPLIYAEFQYDGVLDTLILTNLETGETLRIDVTGETAPPHPENPDPGYAVPASSGDTTHTGFCEAFGWPVRYTIRRIDLYNAYAVAQALDPG